MSDISCIQLALTPLSRPKAPEAQGLNNITSTRSFRNDNEAAAKAQAKTRGIVHEAALPKPSTIRVKNDPYAETRRATFCCYADF